MSGTRGAPSVTGSGRWTTRRRIPVVAIALAIAAAGVGAIDAQAASGKTYDCYRADYGCVAGTGYGGAAAWGYPGPHNCALYAAYRLAQNGYESPSGLGNGSDWDERARARGIAVNMTPAVGSIAQVDGGAGHVMYVEAVHADHIVVTEDNWRGGTGRARITRGSAYWNTLEFIHFRDRSSADVNGDGRADLVLVGHNQTGSGRTEAHVLDGASGYTRWLGNWVTASGYAADANSEWVMGDVNGDGRADLVLVGHNQTGSGRTEAHVLDGASGYTRWLGNWVTASGYAADANSEWVMGDVNGDGRADLVLVGHNQTGSGRTEAHVLDGASGYTRWLGNWVTASGYAADANSEWVMGDVNGDGRADLVLVGHNQTGSGRTEAHVLDGASGYTRWLGNWVTASGYAADANSEWVMGDVNGDGRADLVLVGHNQTGSGRTEAHVLDGASGYTRWLGNWVTTSGYAADANSEWVMGG